MFSSAPLTALCAGAPHIELCQQCTGSCGKLSHGYMIPHEDMGGLPTGAILHEGSSAQCIDNFCVPKAVKDPWGLCTAIQQDSNLLHGMKRKLMSAVRPLSSCSEGRAMSACFSLEAWLHHHTHCCVLSA